ncbi:hypothetical protein ABPG77_001765 [Micractinium sp. CCAP 211/92]
MSASLPHAGVSAQRPHGRRREWAPRFGGWPRIQVPVSWRRVDKEARRNVYPSAEPGGGSGNGEGGGSAYGGDGGSNSSGGEGGNATSGSLFLALLSAQRKIITAGLAAASTLTGMAGTSLGWQLRRRSCKERREAKARAETAAALEKGMENVENGSLA